MNPIYRLVLIVVLGGVFVLIAVNYVKRPSKPQIVHAALERSPAGYINRDRQAFVAQKLLAMEQQNRAYQSSQLPPPRMPLTRPPGVPSGQPPAPEPQSSQETNAPPEVAEIIIAPDIAELANQLLPPTNEIVHMLGVRAEVRGFDSKGLLLETNFAYMPRFAITNLSKRDLALLLENRMAYSSMTTFGTFVRRTKFSETFESRLRQIWLNGNTLTEKLQTRFAVMDLMGAYNGAVGTYARSGQSLAQAGQSIANANRVLGNATVSELNAYADIDNFTDNKISEGMKASRAESYAQHTPRLSNQRNAIQTAESDSQVSVTQQGQAQIQANVAENNIAASLINAKLLSARLAEYGIKVPGSPPFIQIPPLSMRLEIDAERIKNQKKTAP